MQLLIPTLLLGDLGAKETRSSIRAAVGVTAGCLRAPCARPSGGQGGSPGGGHELPSPGPRLIAVSLPQPALLLTGAGGGPAAAAGEPQGLEPSTAFHTARASGAGAPKHLRGSAHTVCSLLLVHVCLETGARQQGKISVRAPRKAPSQHNPTRCPWDRAVHSPFPRFSRCTGRGRPSHHPLPPRGAELAPALAHCSSTESRRGCSIPGRTQRALPAPAGSIAARLGRQEEMSSGCGYNNCRPHGIFKICLLRLLSSSSLPSFLARAPGDE